MQRFAAPARLVLVQGLLFGVILAAAELLVDFSARLVSDTSILGTIALALNFIFGAVAGFYNARRTGRIGLGAVAGLLTGLIGSLIDNLVNVLVLLPNLDKVVHNAQVYSDQHHLGQHYTPSLVLQIYLSEVVYALILAMILALLGGFLGGTFGRRRFVPPTPVEEQETPVGPPSAPVQ